MTVRLRSMETMVTVVVMKVMYDVDADTDRYRC